MPEDEVRVGVRRDGRLIMFDGRHRLVIARLLGVPEIPVRVVVRHRDWVAFRQSIVDYIDSSLRGRVYQEIDHPDLRDLPAKHGTERIAIFLAGLEGYEAAEGPPRSRTPTASHASSGVTSS